MRYDAAKGSRLAQKFVRTNCYHMSKLYPHASRWCGRAHSRGFKGGVLWVWGTIFPSARSTTFLRGTRARYACSGRRQQRSWLWQRAHGDGADNRCHRDRVHADHLVPGEQGLGGPRPTATLILPRASSSTVSSAALPVRLPAYPPASLRLRARGYQRQMRCNKPLFQRIE